MTLHLTHIRRHRAPWRRAGPVLVAIGGLLVLSWLVGCAAPTAQQQRIVDVICGTDAALQPIIVPVAVAVAAPTPAGAPVAAAAGLDTALVHPAVVAACAVYGTRPVAVVAVPAVKPL
ncbi:MAG TPA: hypothetical protein VNH21_12440 [Steroidobacteraceae bacterium]|nr:hypothetical protein [Steroidobacteraceae bacterium]